MYDILKGEIWRESMEVTEKCGVCDEVKGLGDNIELPCKKEEKA